jgi:hypothetical protein
MAPWYRIVGLINEAVYVGGIFILLWGMLSPVPWFSTKINLTTLTPYWVGQGYQKPSICTRDLGDSNSTAIPTTSFRFAHSVTRESRDIDPFVRRADGGNNTSRMVWIGVLGKPKCIS